MRAVLDETVARINYLPGPVFREMLPLVIESQRDIAESLAHWMRNEDGAARFTAYRYNNVLANLGQALESAKKREPTLLAALTKGGEAAAVAATTNVVWELEQFSAMFGESTLSVAFDVAGAIKSGRALLYPQFESSAARYAGAIGQRVTDILAMSRLKGESIFELSRTLEKKLPHVFAGDRADCLRLARSETMNAYNAYHYESYNELRDDDQGLLLRWDGSYDSRRCEICASLDGQVIDPSKGEKFRSVRGDYYDRPTAHPCCRCVCTPWRESWAVYARPQTPRAPVGFEAL